MTDKDKSQDAIESYEWLEAYVWAGFTREEAMQILCRVNVHIHEQKTLTPDTLEFYERQNALASKLLTEINE